MAEELDKRTSHYPTILAKQPKGAVNTAYRSKGLMFIQIPTGLPVRENSIIRHITGDRGYIQHSNIQQVSHANLKSKFHDFSRTKLRFAMTIFYECGVQSKVVYKVESTL